MDEEAMNKLFSDRELTDPAETTQIVRLRARSTKLGVPERPNMPEQVANELAACARRFEGRHRRNTYEASKLFDRMMTGKLDDTQSDACHLFERQVADVRRNRLNLASVQAQMSNKAADIPPGRRRAVECEEPLSAQHKEMLDEAFLLVSTSKVGANEKLTEEEQRKKRQMRLLGEKEEIKTDLNKARHLMDQTRSSSFAKCALRLISLVRSRTSGQIPRVG